MNKKKQNVLVGIICLIGVAIIVLMLHLSGKEVEVGSDDYSETFTLKVYYQDNSLVIDDVLEFNENETLLEVMERNYEITTRKDGANYAVLSINEYTSNFVTSYFSLYVNGKYSSIGANSLKVTGGLDIEWKWIEL